MSQAARHPRDDGCGFLSEPPLPLLPLLPGETVKVLVWSLALTPAATVSV